MNGGTPFFAEKALKMGPKRAPAPISNLGPPPPPPPLLEGTAIVGQDGCGGNDRGPRQGGKVLRLRLVLWLLLLRLLLRVPSRSLTALLFYSLLFSSYGPLHSPPHAHTHTH